MEERKPRRVDASKIHAGEGLEITLKGEIADDEQPVVVTREPGAVVVLSYEEDRVRIKNTTDHSLIYILFVVPKRYMQVAQLPWRDLFDDFKVFGQKLRERRAARKLRKKG